MPDAPSRPPSTPTPPFWSDRLLALAVRLAGSLDPGSRDRLRGDAWVLLNGGLLLFLRREAAKSTPLPREDLEDLAAEKALDLLLRIESGRWDLTGREPGELRAFLATVARNRLINFRKQGARLRRVDRPEPGESRVEDTDPLDRVPDRETADLPLERQRFAEAVRRCAGRLSDRARKIWLFRVFGELSSRQIADHPEIRLTITNVDVILHRARHSMRECLAGSGFTPGQTPPGCFTELLRAFLAEGLPWGTGRNGGDRA